MGFFYSTIKLNELIKDSGSIAKELKGNDTNWYFSKEGEKAYTDATTLSQKTMYFYNYLTTLSKSKKNRDILLRCAYVMANSMDSSSLEFAGYPNILDPSKNPLVNCVKNTRLESKERTVYGVILLAALNHETDAKKHLNTEDKPYTRLTYCETDSGMTDKNKIEKDIIDAFCVDFSERYMKDAVKRSEARH